MNTKQFSGSAIATPHFLASEAGAKALKAGGNAIDAALAAAATLCVVYPNNVALGGDMVALVRSPDGRVRFLNATGPSAKAESLANLRAKHGSKLPLRGVDTVTVPGAICGWNSLHEYGAELEWADHFKTAIALAAEGFSNSKSVAAELAKNSDVFIKDQGMRDIFYPHGKPLGEGQQLKQPALAQSLQQLAEGGSAAFYTGELAQKWISGLNKLGSKITLADTTEYNAYWAEPLVGEFAGLQVLTSPPNTSGFMFLRALNAISAGIDDPLGAGARELAKVFAEAKAVRVLHLSDPQFAAVTGAELVAMEAPKHPYEVMGSASGDTIGLSVASADGWAVSLINSIYYGFGAGILEPETGIIFQNRGTAFSLTESEASVFEPGKRPKHTLMPAMILKNGKPLYIPATMGGAAQPQIHTQLLLHLLNGATPVEATHSPRWIVREPDPEGVIRIFAEENLPTKTLKSLREGEIPVEIIPTKSEGVGHSNLIEITPNDLLAASDPRSDGAAIVIP